MFGEFQRRMRAAGWTLYPETLGHDLVMVAATVAGVEPGTQVVVEGKLRATPTLLRQALPPDLRRHEGRAGADFYAVLVPSFDDDFRQVADALGIIAIAMRPDRSWSRWDAPTWPERYRCLARAPLQIPGIALDIAAGAPAPRALTPWKEAAVKACLTGLERPIGAEDLGIARRAMIARGWVERIGTGRPVVYRLVDAADRPDRLYPEVVAAVLASGWTPAIRHGAPLLEAS